MLSVCVFLKLGLGLFFFFFASFRGKIRRTLHDLYLSVFLAKKWWWNEREGLGYTSLRLFKSSCAKYYYTSTLFNFFAILISLARLKEEERLVGMPEWKKNLLTRKGSGQIYRDYNTAGNSVRTSNSMAPDPYSAWMSPRTQVLFICWRIGEEMSKTTFHITIAFCKWINCMM